VAKVRLYEIARELDLESKDVVAAAQELGLDVKTASSGVEEADAAQVKSALTKPKTKTAPKPKAAPKPVVEPEPKPAPEPVVEPEVALEPAPGFDPVGEVAPEGDRRKIAVASGITPQELASELNVAPSDIVGALIQMGEMVGVTVPIPDAAMDLLGDHFGLEIGLEVAEEEGEAPTPKAKRAWDDDPSTLVRRPPVITVMGHVDHGKTSLLDRIRSENVAAGEAGGITQHIGAYQVKTAENLVTFLDTPGHEAFTALRARGAEVTDIVVLVVAADDGIMPQTEEAISHSKAAGVPIVVAINKMDLPAADPHRIRAQLTEHELVAEELGGDVPTVELSAETGDGVSNLLEVLDLIAQLEEFSANPTPAASGVIVESQLDKGRGPVATVIVQRGTLKQGDALVAGHVSGRVRAMLDHNGEQVKAAGPSTPVLVMGWGDVPTSGDPFDVQKNERTARSIAAATLDGMKKSSQIIPTARERLTQLLESLRTADEAELRLILKADANGSLEAVTDSIAKITREGGKITIIHGAVGGITANDVSLAEVTESVIFGFNVRPDAQARKAAESAGIEIRPYQIIYEILNDIEALLVGRLAPDEVEAVLGAAEVRELFKVPRAGTIAGSYITEGQMVRGAKVRLLRSGVVIHTGEIDSLRRFKDDVREVNQGFECGIGIAGYNDIKEGDVVEAYEVKEVARL